MSRMNSYTIKGNIWYTVIYVTVTHEKLKVLEKGCIYTMLVNDRRKQLSSEICNDFFRKEAESKI